MQVPQEDIILIVGGITLVIVVLGAFFLAVVIRNFNARRRRQKEIFNAVLSAQENERTRIAQDLHDEIGPMLSAVRLNVGLLNLIHEPTEIHATVKEAQGNLDSAIKDVRRISHNLVPNNIDTKGLTGAIRDHINYIQKGGTVNISFISFPLDFTFSKLVDTNLYRILQEVISNAMRHGQATQLNIQMTNENKELSIIVSDNGKGFDIASSYEGIGLKSIRSRVQLYGGLCEWHSSKEEGTRFEAVFNIKELS